MRRYDAAVSFSLALLIYGCVAKRPSLAGIGLGLGVVAKGLPVLLVPLPVLYYLSMRRWRELAIATTCGLFFGLLVGLPMVVPAGAHLFDILSYHGGRPLQIESTAGALLILSRLLPQSNVAITHTYGSNDLVGNGEPILRSLASVLPVLSLLGVWLWSFFAFRRAPDEPLKIASCSSPFVLFSSVMALGKVFSPQYLTWLLPIGVLVSLREDFSGRSLFLGALLLTQLDLSPSVIGCRWWRGPRARSLASWCCFATALIIARQLGFSVGSRCFRLPSLLILLRRNELRLARAV